MASKTRAQWQSQIEDLIDSAIEELDCDDCDTLVSCLEEHLVDKNLDIEAKREDEEVEEEDEEEDDLEEEDEEEDD